MTVEDQAVAHKGLGINVGRCLGLFNANYGMIEASDSEWLHNKINFLIGLFWRYGLVENVAKLLTMTFQPRAIRPGMSKEAVGRRCTGVGELYHE